MDACETQDYLAAAFDVSPNPCMLVIPDDYRVLRANRAAQDASPSGRAPVQDVPCFAYLFGGKTPCPGCALRAPQGGIATFKIGDRNWQASFHPLAQALMVACHYRDLTDEVARNNRLIESEKMRSMGMSARGVAHEINNVLQAILAFSQLMAKEPGRSTDESTNLQFIEQSARRCARIVGSLLRLGRIETEGDAGPCDLAAIVEDAFAIFKGQLMEYPKVRFEVAHGQSLPMLYGDAGRLGQVVLNLFSNALQALENGEGKVTVRTGVVDAYCFVAVRDSGVGIPEEDFPRLFDTLFTTKPPGQGAGIGLSITYQIVKEHGGHFLLDSKVGEGSEFTVMLPINRGINQ